MRETVPPGMEVTPGGLLVPAGSVPAAPEAEEAPYYPAALRTKPPTRYEKRLWAQALAPVIYACALSCASVRHAMTEKMRPARPYGR